MAAASTSSQKPAPPSPQEIARKLSISHKPVKKPNLPVLSSLPAARGPSSGNESDSDSLISPDLSSSSIGAVSWPSSANAAISHPPLTAIAEASGPGGSAEETDDDDDDGDMWRAGDKVAFDDGVNERHLKAGYLWKKGARRKTWKKRWFVLRPLHLAYYKTSAEYKLLRLLDLSDIHAVTPCSLKRHAYTFGLVSPSRNFYLQAASQQDLDSWVKALNEVREALMTTSTVTGLEAPTPPIEIPPPIAIFPTNHGGGGTTPTGSFPAMSSSPMSRGSHSPGGQYVTSSDDEDFVWPPSVDTTSPMPLATSTSATPGKSVAVPVKDPSKTVLSGYLMKCGQKRRTWRKRWFVLTGQKLYYSGSHMDTKKHREIDLEHILDALEYNPFSQGGGAHHAHGLTTSSSSHTANAPIYPSDETVEPNHTFKIVTTKRSLLLSAPSEMEEIKWLSAVRALIARRASTTTTMMTTTTTTSSNNPGGSMATTAKGASPTTGSTSTWLTQPSAMQTPIRGSAGHDQTRGSSSGGGSGSNSGSTNKRDGELGHSRQRSTSASSGGGAKLGGR